jgi:predicted membrane-bound mannosyltransferase
VYAHTSLDIRNLVEKVEALARVHPQGNRMLIKVMAPDGDYWPLPWYLRRFKQVGWWDRIPADPFAPVMIVSSKLEAAFDDRTDKTHLMAGYFQLRPQVLLELYVEIDLWRTYIQSLPPVKD